MSEAVDKAHEVLDKIQEFKNSQPHAAEIGEWMETRHDAFLARAVIQLENECDELRYERDFYQSEMHRLNELTSQMTSAAQGAAGTAVRAIEEIQSLMHVVDAAVAWRKSFDKGNADIAETVRLAAELRNKVDTHLEHVKNRS